MDQDSYYLLMANDKPIEFHGKLFLFADEQSYKSIQETEHTVLHMTTEQIRKIVPAYGYLVVILQDGVRYHYNVFPPSRYAVAREE
jgi:hypothetical protein